MTDTATRPEGQAVGQGELEQAAQQGANLSEGTSEAKTTAPPAPRKVQKLTGRQKAAAMLVQLGSEQATRVLREMSDVEVVELVGEVAKLPPLDVDTVREIVNEFVQAISLIRSVGQGGIEAARKVLRERLGSARAEELLSRLFGPSGSGPLTFLNSVAPSTAASFLSNEHPQTVAIVLAHLSSENAAEILSLLDEDMRAEVAKRIGRMSRVSPEVVRQAAEVLERRLSTFLETSGSLATGGVQPLVNILNHSDRQVEKQILTSLDERDPELAEEVRSRLFTFEDIVMLEDRSLQLVLRHVNTKDLATALKGVTRDVREKFERNMTARASAELDEEIQALGPVRLTVVEGAQADIVRIVRDLEAAGEIVMTREADELVV
jgi:flagellar motor switch protein FliG